MRETSAINAKHRDGDTLTPSRYAAFLSYAHTDERAAKRLHRRLETYPVPKGQALNLRNRLKPIFRDTAELSAHHSLPDTIRAALAVSTKLIVLCSPAAKASQWVNAEIELFRELHGDAGILCALINGTPETSFPDALTVDGREPLAADLSGGRDGFRFGTTQLAASLMGVGLDTLIQREAKRRRQRAQSVVGGASVISLIMGGLTFAALSAQRTAETNRAEAEALVEYMIGELKTQLQPVGRLDILSGVGERVMDYYSGQDLSKIGSDRLARRARAQHTLVEVAIDGGDLDAAQLEAEAAYPVTRALHTRTPNDPDAIFIHAQSAYWLGEVAFQAHDYATAKTHHADYRRLGYQLAALKPGDFDALMEAAWGDNNMGRIENRLQNFDAAEVFFDDALAGFDAALAIDGLTTAQRSLARREKANTLVGAAEVAVSNRKMRKAKIHTDEQVGIYKKEVEAFPYDFNMKFRLLQTQDNYTSLFLSKEVHQNSNGSSSNEIKRLYERDKSNKKWALKYYHELYKDAISNPSALEKQLNFLNVWTEINTRFDLPVLEKFWVRYAYLKFKGHTKITIANVDKSELSETPADLTAWLKSQNITNSRDGEATIKMARILNEIGSDADAEYFAEQYLQYRWNQKFEQFPSIMTRKADAAIIVKDCALANQFIKSLQGDNFPYNPPTRNISGCVIPITDVSQSNP